MFRTLLACLALVASSFASTPAQAGVICSFGGTGTAGSDCLGQTWRVENGGWGIPGILFGTVPWPGPITATDFHWRCLEGCGRIENAAGDDTRFQVSPFRAGDFWDEAVNGAGDTIDFTAPVGGGLELTTGRDFFVNITVAIIDPAKFRFEAWWTDDRATPEPSSIALIGLALLGLGLSRQRSRAA